MDMNGLHEIVNNLRIDFKDFKKNDFAHLSERVDKLSVRIAWIVGIFSGVVIAVNIILRLL